MLLKTFSVGATVEQQIALAHCIEREAIKIQEGEMYFANGKKIEEGELDNLADDFKFGRIAPDGQEMDEDYGQIIYGQSYTEDVMDVCENEGGSYTLQLEVTGDCNMRVCLECGKIKQIEE